MDEENLPLDEEKEEVEEPESQPESEAPEEEEPEAEPEPVTAGPKKKGCGFWKILTIIFFILLVISIFTHGFRFGGITGEAVAETKTGKISVTILSDSRCKECDTTNLVAQLNTVFGDLKVTELDYGDA